MVGFDAAVRELNSAGREIGSAAEGRLGFRCLSGDIVGAKMIPRLPGTTLHRELPGDRESHAVRPAKSRGRRAGAGRPTASPLPQMRHGDLQHKRSIFGWNLLL